MFRDVKQLKIKEAESNLYQLKRQMDTIWAKFDALKKQESDLKSVINYIKKEQASGTGDFVAQKYSLVKRLFNSKANQEYRAYKSALARLNKFENKLRTLPVDIQLAVMDASNALTNTNLDNRILGAQNTILELEKARSLSDFNMSLVEAIKYLEDNHVTPVLDRSDCNIIENPLVYQEKNDLLWVHETNLMPKQGLNYAGVIDGEHTNRTHVETPHEAGVEITNQITIDGKDYRYSYPDDTKTLFGTLNGKKEFDPQHDDPQKQRYTILQPLAGIQNDRIGSLTSENTYITGKMFGDSGLDLTRDAWVLCPKNEFEFVKKNNRSVHVIGYEPDAINGLPERGVVNAFISQLGYHVQPVGQNSKQLQILAERENLSLKPYAKSLSAMQDACMNNTNQGIAIMKTLIDNRVIKSSQDYQRIKPQIDRQFVAHYYLPNNRDNFNFLLGGMYRVGMKVNEIERDDLQRQIEDENSLNAREVREELTVDELVNKIMVDNALRARNKTSIRIM